MTGDAITITSAVAGFSGLGLGLALTLDDGL
jgi:hypothetical protein